MSSFVFFIDMLCQLSLSSCQYLFRAWSEGHMQYWNALKFNMTTVYWTTTFMFKKCNAVFLQPSISFRFCIVLDWFKKLLDNEQFWIWDSFQIYYIVSNFGQIKCKWNLGWFRTFLSYEHHVYVTNFSLCKYLILSLLQVSSEAGQECSTEWDWICMWCISVYRETVVILHFMVLQFTPTTVCSVQCNWKSVHCSSFHKLAAVQLVGCLIFVVILCQRYSCHWLKIVVFWDVTACSLVDH
jgi:hypothetical protein